jgi:hypothetical protein
LAFLLLILYRVTLLVEVEEVMRALAVLVVVEQVHLTPQEIRVSQIVEVVVGDLTKQMLGFKVEELVDLVFV